MNDASEITRQILVVDDESIVVSLVRDTLEEEGMVVHTAETGTQALEIIARQNIDLIISDIRMPGMDGIELVRRAKEMLPEVAVIFITGYANLNSAKNAIKQGAFDYIMKPFELSEIRQAVRNALEKKQESAAARGEEQLTKLNDLSSVLFSTGDANSVITSSLKFAMMHQHADQGAMIYRNRNSGQTKMISIVGEETVETEIPREPLTGLLNECTRATCDQPVLVSQIGDHPLYKAHPDNQLKEMLFPAWKRDHEPMIVVPVHRPDFFYGMLMVGFHNDTVKVRSADMKFLSITGSQLAITLENLSLLHQTQEAYARLKELQDETIQLETMATRGVMSAEIGHELNNFLAVVQGNLSLLDLQLKKENYQSLPKYVQTMGDTIKKIERFTSDLMSLTPISGTKEVMSFDKTFLEVIEYLRPQKRFRGVTVDVPAELPEILFDSDGTQIQQLLYNLFNNAADATFDSQERRISAAIRRDDETGRFRFTISDTGCGFAPEVLAKAFQERFTTKKSGHGFGLVVCKRIVENHGGALHIDSEQGRGTTITVDFPLAPITAQEPAMA